MSSVAAVGLHRQDGCLVQIVVYLSAEVGVYLPVFVVNTWGLPVARV